MSEETPAKLDFADYQEFADPLRLPICGKTYTIPEPSFTDAITLQGLANGGDIPEDLKDASGEKLARFVLGPVYDEMLADDVPNAAFNRAIATAMTDVTRGRFAAWMMWKVGNSPEALAAIAAANQQIAGSPALEESETPTETPSTGITSPTAGKPAPVSKKSPARRGRKSSATGGSSKATSRRSSTST